MLRYRATEIRLTSQDVDETSKRLASRRAAANTRSTICQLPGPTGTGPRLRRGPERSRDESIIHADGSSAAQFNASLESAGSTEKQSSTVSDKDPQPASHLGHTSAADDISYTSEPELAGKPVLLGRVDQRVPKRTSLSPKKHDHGAANSSHRLLQLDGPSDPAARKLVSPEKTRSATLSPSAKDVVHEQRTQDPSARFAAGKPSASSHQSRTSDPLLYLETQDSHDRFDRPTRGSPFQGYIATSTGTHQGLPVWYNAEEVKSHPRDSVMDGTFDMAQVRVALEEGALATNDALPSIRLPSPTSTHSSSDSGKRYRSLPSLTALSPARRVSRSPSVTQASEYSSRNISQTFSHFRTTSTPDLLRPLLSPASAPSTGSRHASGAISADNSPTSSAAMLELIRQDSSPLERLEQETRSQMSHAPSARLGSATAASSRLQSPALGELRMPTFESPERPSPYQRRAARYRNVPTFAETPNAPFSTSFDLLPPFDYSPPSLQPGTFIDRYPGSVTTGRRRGTGTDQGTTSMPSLPASRSSRRGTSGHSHAPAQVTRNTQLGAHHWSRGRGGGEDAMQSRRNTVGGQQRLRRYRSISARLLPSWQDEQENSGRAERMQVMAEIQERRRYVEQTNDGRLDRTPPSLGRFERELLQH